MCLASNDAIGDATPKCNRRTQSIEQAGNREQKLLTSNPISISSLPKDLRDYKRKWKEGCQNKFGGAELIQTKDRPMILKCF